MLGRKSPKMPEVSSGETAVRVRDACFAYEDALVVDHVSLEVTRGQIVALVGPNGCGKSTLLRLLAGLDFASSGTVEVLGQPVDGQSMADARTAKRLHQRAGLVFQNPDVQLFCPSVEEEVAFGPRQMGLSDEEVNRRVDDSLALFDVTHLRQRAPYHLSGGEKRRVALACVVSLAPELLLLDEVTDGLDEESREMVMGFLRDYADAGGTVLLTSHHAGHIDELGARRVRMGADHRIQD